MMDQGGVAKNLGISHDFSAPGTTGSIYQPVARFLQFRRTTQKMGGHLVRLDRMRMEDARRNGRCVKEDSKMRMEGPLQELSRRRFVKRMPPVPDLKNRWP